MAANLSAVSSLRRDVKDGNAREKRRLTASLTGGFFYRHKPSNALKTRTFLVF
jgi:hypothetical protein